MDLAAKTRLGPYEIIEAIGAGGMGEVYRARDTRLDRYVAIKILLAHFAASPELKSRFEREARTLSSVTHPHICHLYDVGSQSGVDFLVMEFLEGETLASRLQKGPLPLNELLRIGVEITDALAKAHRLGLVHRDLKPSNIMISKNGAKLMDFGLAKPAAASAVAAARPRTYSGEATTSLPGSASPIAGGETATMLQNPPSPITGVGTVVGTIQYMSPEQIEGKEADARSDIFALGAVLYEMATGRRAFDGKSQLSIASAILQKEPPPVTDIQPTSPPPLDYLIRTCLAKDPEDRFQTAQDVKLQLTWLQSGTAAFTPAATAAQPRRWWMISGLSAAFVLLLAVLLFKFAARPAGPEYGVTRLTVTLPPKQELAADVTQAVAISPDGKRLAYVAADSGVSHLFVRRLDQFAPVAIPDSEGVIFPFFSPDGTWIAFFNQGKLKKAPSDGGQPVVISEGFAAIFGGTWTPRDVILLSVPNFGLGTVPASGGSLQKISVATRDLVYPQGLTWLAEGDWVAFTDYLSPRRSLMAVKVASGELRPLFDNALSPSYSAGHLLYYQGGALWAVPFDPQKVAVLGNPYEIESGITEENYIAQAAASRNGVLAYAPGPAGNFLRNLFLVNRRGQEQKLDVPPNDYIDPAFSPDGKRIALTIRNVQQLEVLERDRGTVTSFVTHLTSYFAPVWTADGRNLILDGYDASRQRAIYRLPADGSSEPQLLLRTPHTSHVTSIAGDYAAVMVNDPVTSTDLWLLDLHSPYDLRPFKRTPAVERQGSLSPDGRWMAYASNDSGRSEIYVEPVPGPGGRRQISSDGGDQPRWVRNGREIIYRNGTKVMSVPLQLQPFFSAEKPIELFDRKFDPGAAVPGYDVSPDGQTFIMTRSELENPTEIRVVLDWPAGKPAQK